MQQYRILSKSSEEQLSTIAASILQKYAASQIKLLSGPQRGLVMLRVKETVANSLFNAGEILVTEVKLELDGQFGYGMVLGDNPRKAMAVALIDAALRKNGPLSQELETALAELERQQLLHDRHMYELAATTKVQFETM